MKKNILHTLMLMGTIIIIVFAISSLSIAKEFNDLPATHWAHKYISELADRGTINGYSDGTFRPSKQITRAEFIKLIVSESYFNVDYSNDALEASKNYGDHWWEFYYDLVKNIIPYDYSSDIINLPISRIEVANLLNVFANKDFFYQVDEYNLDITDEEIEEQYEDFRQVLMDMGITKTLDLDYEEVSKYISKLSEKNKDEFYERFDKLQEARQIIPYNVIVNTFSDVDVFDDSDRLAVSNVSRLGLMIGYDDGNFKPEKYMTRAEVATIIYRYADLKGGK